MAEKSPNRRDRLDKWLSEREALLLWTARRRTRDVRSNTRYVEAYSIKGQVVIVVKYDDGHGGWDVFTAPRTIDITLTLADADKRLGITADLHVDCGHPWSSHLSEGCMHRDSQTEICLCKATPESASAQTKARAILARNLDENEFNTIEDAVELAELVLGK